MRRTAVRFGAFVTAMLLTGLMAGRATGNEGKANRMASPTPGASPVARERDPASGAPEVGVGRSTGAMKGSGDEGGTAAGMPGKGPASGH